jgi:hypothetical protein
LTIFQSRDLAWPIKPSMLPLVSSRMASWISGFTAAGFTADQPTMPAHNETIKIMVSFFILPPQGAFRRQAGKKFLKEYFSK